MKKNAELNLKDAKLSPGGRQQRQWQYLAVKKLSVLLRETTSKHYGDIFSGIAFILLQLKKNLNCIEEYAKIIILLTLEYFVALKY